MTCDEVEICQLCSLVYTEGWWQAVSTVNLQRNITGG